MLVNIFYRIINYLYSIFCNAKFQVFRQQRRLRKREQRKQKQQQRFDQDLVIFTNLNNYININKYIDDVKILINIKSKIDNNNQEVELLRQKFHKYLTKLVPMAYD